MKFVSTILVLFIFTIYSEVAKEGQKCVVCTLSAQTLGQRKLAVYYSIT